MTRHWPAKRSRRGKWAWLLLPLVVLGAALYQNHRSEQVEQEQRLREAERTAQLVAVNAALLASGSFELAEHFCRELWRERLGVFQQPQALAWTQQGIAAYFQHGVDRHSLRLVRCRSEGVEFGPRIVHPLAAELPLEMPIDLANDRSGLSAAVLSDLQQTSLTLDADLLGIELLRRPSDGGVWRREWRGLEGGAVASVESDPPAAENSAIEFPLLIAQAQFPIRREQMPATPVPKRAHDWLNQPLAALDAVAKVLPPGALISEIMLQQSQIKILITGDVPAIDDRLATAYGSLELDEYGIAASAWWYPRDSAGFGCAAGRSLTEVRKLLQAESLGSRLHQAWYTCSPAFGDGRDGVWVLR